MTTPPSAEFSRIVAVDRIDRAGATHHLVATPREREQLKVRLGLLGLDRLEATLDAHRNPTTGLIRLEGDLEAVVHVECVVSLEPFAYTVREHIDLRLTTVPDVMDSSDVFVDPGDDTDVEPFSGNMLDLGEIVAQHLSLALDPHPRSPDAILPENATDPVEDHDGEPMTPFAALEPLRRKM